ncbi:MAG: peptidoglycan DD-metalloendopeptidase family protein [Cytophagales bacterium]|nr:peptidoglycan DD-metalloendopeptidase family protein [Cytophagales bacterium]
MKIIRSTTPPIRFFSLSALILTLFLTACASQKGVSGYTNQAPVEDRSGAATKAPLGIENAGKPGFYTVKPGDKLIRIGLDNGQNWRDIARWNQLENPNQIEVGQVLRVVPPAANPAVAVATPVPRPGSGAGTVAVATPVPPPVVSTPLPAAPPKAAVDDLNWMWPTPAGTVLMGFDEVKNKGLDLGGRLGDPVFAALDGRVVYAGAGLRGYGNLIILKHNDMFLSAYAHNQTLLVKEDQLVVKGQKIAEMGQSDSDGVKLHFEIRKQGKPVDPAQYLPKR